jgi:hypothetical protein
VTVRPKGKHNATQDPDDEIVDDSLVSHRTPRDPAGFLSAADALRLHTPTVIVARETDELSEEEKEKILETAKSVHLDPPLRYDLRGPPESLEQRVARMEKVLVKILDRFEQLDGARQ